MWRRKWRADLLARVNDLELEGEELRRRIADLQRPEPVQPAQILGPMSADQLKTLENQWARYGDSLSLRMSNIESSFGNLRRGQQDLAAAIRVAQGKSE